MIKLGGINISCLGNQKDIKNACCTKLKCRQEDIKEIQILRRSIDARKKEDIRYVYTLCLSVKNEERILRKFHKSNEVSSFRKYVYDLPRGEKLSSRPVIVGFGPAGMFAALILAMHGDRPIVLERGSCVEKRIADTEKFAKSGILDPESNIQFGEGGAGTFSDGKLNTGINDPRIRFVLEEFAANGAADDILIDAKPHIGTDVLREVVKNIRKKIISLGGEIIFDSRLSDIAVEKGRVCGAEYIKNGLRLSLDCQRLILATGHSARDIFFLMQEKDILISRKNFSVGVRIEHLRQDIDRSLYGENYERYHLPSASYKAAVHLENGRSCYTFCMCPGGEISPAASEPGGVVTNGMSLFARKAENSNSALLVGLEAADLKGTDPLEGIRFQRQIEEKAFEVCGRNYKAPAVTYGDFVSKRARGSFGKVRPSYPVGTEAVLPDDYLPDFVCETLRLGIPALGRKIRGFDSPEAVITGPESRSTSPVRINRNEEGESLSVRGLYPCGEGAGYAGGIMSAAVDGIKTAEKLISGQCVL